MARAFEEFIITRDLFIINEANDTPTFETNRGHSWIDLTICNNILAQKTWEWTCGEEESCADHKIIFFLTYILWKPVALRHTTQENTTSQKQITGKKPVREF